jgi:hypothetical protein
MRISNSTEFVLHSYVAAPHVFVIKRVFYLEVQKIAFVVLCVLGTWESKRCKGGGQVALMRVARCAPDVLQAIEII